MFWSGSISRVWTQKSVVLKDVFRFIPTFHPKYFVLKRFKFFILCQDTSTSSHVLNYVSVLLETYLDQKFR